MKAVFVVVLCTIVVALGSTIPVKKDKDDMSSNNEEKEEIQKNFIDHFLGQLQKELNKKAENIRGLLENVNDIVKEALKPMPLTGNSVVVMKSTVDVCSLPIDMGPGMYGDISVGHRYGYDSKTKSCRDYLYRGRLVNKARGKTNSFYTLEDCQAACERD